MSSNNNSIDSFGEERVGELKRYRESIYSPSFKNAIRRKLQTWNSGLPRKELLRHLFSLVWNDAKYRLRNFYQKLASSSSKVQIPESNQPAIVAKINGGLGDLIVAARFLSEMCRIYGLNLAVEYKTPSLASVVFARFPGFLGSIRGQFDVSQEPCVGKLEIGLGVELKYLAATAPTALRDATRRAGSFSAQFSHFVNHSPFLDGLLGDQLASIGVRRHEVGFWQYGLPYSNAAFLKPALASIEDFLSSEGLGYKSYITISDGWDADFGMLNGRRPTKAMPIESLTRLIEELNAARPDLKIIQVGGILCGEDLPATAANYRGKMSLSDSAMLIAGALVHIDTEGGLVHLAEAVGTPSAVFFGPTSRDFFSYKTNLSLCPSNSCTNCWWTTNTWMAACPLKLEKTCMQKHDISLDCKLILNFVAGIETRPQLNH